MSIHIKEMTITDLEEIKDILYSDFDDFWTYSILKEEIESKNSYFVVGKNDSNEIVGFAGIKVIIDEADIMNIVTRRDFRQMGVASSLLEYLIDYAKSINLKKITLEVNENNLSAIHLYDKFNFDNIGIRKKYYNGESDAFIMSKNL